MFLVKDQHHGATLLVFTWGDPREDGYKGDVIEDVTLDFDKDAIRDYPDFRARSKLAMGRRGDDLKHYKVFKYSSERESAGYQPVAGTPVVFGSWSDYLRSHRPEQLAEDQWFDFLDTVDEAARSRRQRDEEPDSPKGKSRDEVAAWAAKQHLFVDSGIREVWYLPEGAPADEIRFLELNDRFAANGSNVEAIGFGLDFDGARFRLLVADITSEQLEEIKRDRSRLPAGWSLDRNTIWRRRA